MKADDLGHIDIVIAWVDGNDPSLKEKRMRYQQATDAASDAISSTRFASNNEIYYNIASILKYVPFYRYIYIVTDEQTPVFIDEFVEQGLCEAGKIRIIDHKEIFKGYGEHLPTFNSTSIETMLWNISGLSDYFIYMNDDFFFNQPAAISDFLDGNNMIIHGHWRKKLLLNTKLQYRKFISNMTNSKMQPKYIVSQMLGAKTQENRFFEIHHYPHIIDKKTLKNFLLSNPTLLNNQIKFKFRHISQFDPVSVINHLKIKQGEAILKPKINLNYLKNERSVDKFLADLENESIKYGCIQSMDLLDSYDFKRVNTSMVHKFSSHLPKSLL